MLGLAVRTNGKHSANEILALFNSVGDPFATQEQRGPNNTPRTEAPAQTQPTQQTQDPNAAQQKGPIPGDGQAKLGFDQEDRGLKQAPLEIKRETKDAREKDSPRDAREQATFLAK